MSVARGAEASARASGSTATRSSLGQGASNVAGAFTSSFPSSGSFNRIWVNVEAGAQTPLAAAFSAVFLFVAVLALAPLTHYLPLAVMAALLFLVAWGLIDVREMRRVARTQRAEAGVMFVTLAATLTATQFAIFVGVLSSLFVYLTRTTRPRVQRVVPDPAAPYLRFVVPPAGTVLPRDVDIIRVEGSLFFGAVDHVRDELERRHAGAACTTCCCLR